MHDKKRSSEISAVRPVAHCSIKILCAGCGRTVAIDAVDRDQATGLREECEEKLGAPKTSWERKDEP